MTSSDQINQRRAVLESMVQDCILAGVEPPEEILSELSELASTMRANALPQLSPKSWTQWLGTTISGNVLKRLIVNDSYAYLFAAQEADNAADSNMSTVYKLAKAQTLMTAPEARPPLDNATMLLKVEPFDTRGVIPDSNELVALQQRRLSSLSDPSIVTVSDLQIIDGLNYYQMPFYKGASLKDLMVSRAPNDRNDLLLHLVQTAQVLERLHSEYGFYHGNLKPGNILVTKEGVKLSDLGYFGPLQCAEGWLAHGMVSSTAYYPLLAPDDLLALGIALFEMLTGRHPFAADKVLLSIDEQVDGTNLDSELLDEINFKRSILEPYLTPMLRLERPSAIAPWVHGESERILLKALRMNIDSAGVLHKDSGYKDYAELIEGIETIARHHSASLTHHQAQP